MKKFHFHFSFGHLALMILVVGIMTVNGTFLYTMQRKVSTEKKTMEDTLKPAELELTLITTPQCTECFDLSTLVSPLKANEKVKVVKEENIEYTSDEGAAQVSRRR